MSNDGIAIGSALSRPWTDEEDACLRKQILMGNTASMISKTIGRSRNSVIGRAHRMGLSIGMGSNQRIDPRTGERFALRKPVVHAKPAKQEKAPRSGGEGERKSSLSRFFPPKPIETHREKIAFKATAAEMRVEVLQKIEEWAQTPDIGGVPFMKRRPTQCAWMLGSGYQAKVCGKPTASMATGLPSSYCEEHHGLCYTQINLAARLRTPLQGRDPNVIIKKPAKVADDEEVADDLVPIDRLIAGGEDDAAEAA